MLSPMDPTVNSSVNVDYRKKRIKNAQKLELVRLMKANFLFIRGKHAVARSDRSRADIWKVITVRLNGLGPPMQSAEAWQRRWNDMRSATKSKMTKIQNYVREQGVDCPYKLNLVERLIWDTFSVRPEEYMKDLNMKLWREKQQLDGQPSSTGDNSACSPSTSNIEFEQCPNSGWNIEIPDGSGTAWHSSLSYGPSARDHSSYPSNVNRLMEDTDQTRDIYSTESSIQAEPDYDQSSYMEYGNYTTATSTRNGDAMNQWSPMVTSHGGRMNATEPQVKQVVPTELVPGSNVLRDLNKLFDQVLRQNEEILHLLRQSSSDH